MRDLEILRMQNEDLSAQMIRLINKLDKKGKI
jgi:hypothetical protein